jgi:hypothetical protein
MSHFTCEKVRELAAELALDVASGVERAHALEHLASCPDCRALVDDLARTADSILLLAPQVEPPIGFEARAVALARGRRRMPWRWLGAVAAAALVAAIAAGGIVYSNGANDRATAQAHREFLNQIGGRSLRVAFIRTLDGREVGKVYAAQGKKGEPSWLFLVVTDRDGTGNYRVELAPIAGDSIQAKGLFTLEAGKGNWSTTAAIDIEQLQSVRLLDSVNVPEYEATFKK